MMSQFDFQLFFKALGLAFFLEGMFWAVSPEGMKRALSELLRMDNGRVRIFGVSGMVLGLIVCFLFS